MSGVLATLSAQERATLDTLASRLLVGTARGPGATLDLPS